MFWGAYGVIRMLPVLDGTWSWIFTIFFGLVALVGFFTTYTCQGSEHLQYFSNGVVQSFKTFVVSTFLLILVIGGSLKIAMNFDYGHETIKYHRGDYRKLMAMAETYVDQKNYADALYCYEAALERKTSDKKRSRITRRIERVQIERDAYVVELKGEIKTLLNTFNNVSFKYGKPENDLKKTQEKIDELKKLAPSDNDVSAFQKKLDYHNKRKR